MIINNNMKLSSQRVQFLKSIKMIYHPPPPSIQELSNNCPNYRFKPFFLSFFLSSFRASSFFSFKRKKNTHSERILPEQPTLPFRMIYIHHSKPGGGEEVRKRAKWKIRGDYRGSGALAFGLVTLLALEDAWVVYPRDDERGGSSPFVRATLNPCFKHFPSTLRLLHASGSIKNSTRRRRRRRRRGIIAPERVILILAMEWISRCIRILFLIPETRMINCQGINRSTIRNSMEFIITETNHKKHIHFEHLFWEFLSRNIFVSRMSRGCNRI